MNIANDNIILVGFMASGKTTVGTYLSSITNRTFVDTDQLLVEQFGTSIAEFFKTHGENRFRESEKEVIQKTCDQSNQIICTGGGAFISLQNQSIMLSSGKVFWLDVNRNTVLQRIKHDQSERPMLSHPDFEERIDALLNERQPFYEKAHFKIDANSKTVEELSSQILGHIEIQ